MLMFGHPHLCKSSAKPHCIGKYAYFLWKENLCYLLPIEAFVTYSPSITLAS